MQQPVVTVNVLCERTKKEKAVSIPLDQAQKVLEEAAAKTKVAQVLSTDLMAAKTLPDMIVYYRGRLCILANVSEQNDPVVLRHLAEATQRDDLFVVDPASVKRRARKVVKDNPDSNAGT